MKTYLATKEQLESQNRTLSEINSKIAPLDLSKIVVAIMDFVHDDINIIQGGLNSLERIISI